ncbi:glycosyltransferase [Actinomadura scrupuli]|uniref:glycosyltransferase n=1 Tax=Actinomadura scrupuli TaxID=559629 RepID=UPI003D996A4F
MKVFGWAADEVSGCRWYRLQVPLAELARRGHVTGHAERYTPGWDDADVVIGARTCNPGPSVNWQRWAERGRRLVLDIDDDYFRIDRSNREAWEFFARGDVQRRLQANAEMASAVTVCSPRLAEVMRPYNANTIFVPNGLPAEMLTWARPPSREGFVVVGWAGTGGTVHDLPLIAGRLRRFLDRHPNVVVHTVGVPGDAIVRAGLRHERVRVTPWVPGTEAYLRAVAASFDVWCAPYRPTQFNQAKAPTKALEAGALGIPLVASDIVPYRAHVRHGETGYLISRDHEWDAALHELVNDADLRARIGAAARAQAAEHTIETIAPLWERALSGSST